MLELSVVRKLKGVLNSLSGTYAIGAGRTVVGRASVSKFRTSTL
jgi:hypothetical protein